MQYRIGDRDPVTGLYDVIWPDGSATRNGIKIFNSAHEFGDVVLATQRSDGMMILDGVKATLTEVVTNSFGLGGFGEKPVGYLNGQVFNNEEEVILPTVSVKFAPGSLEELAPGAGNFVVRIKIDRPQRKDLRVKCELTGTAGSGDYTYTGLDGDLFAVIPAGQLFIDVAITPIENQSGASQTIALNVIKFRDYRIGQGDGVTMTILVALPPTSFSYIIREKTPDPNDGSNPFSWNIVASGIYPDTSAASIAAYEAIWIGLTSGTVRPGQYSGGFGYASIINGQIIINDVSETADNAYSWATQLVVNGQIVQGTLFRSDFYL